MAKASVSANLLTKKAIRSAFLLFSKKTEVFSM